MWLDLTRRFDVFLSPRPWCRRWCRALLNVWRRPMESLGFGWIWCLCVMFFLTLLLNSFHKVQVKVDRSTHQELHTNAPSHFFALPLLPLSILFKFPLLSAKVTIRELSGDVNLTKAQIDETQIIVTTPEKTLGNWWVEHQSFFRRYLLHMTWFLSFMSSLVFQVVFSHRIYYIFLQVVLQKIHQSLWPVKSCLTSLQSNASDTASPLEHVRMASQILGGDIITRKAGDQRWDPRLKGLELMQIEMTCQVPTLSSFAWWSSMSPHLR